MTLVTLPEEYYVSVDDVEVVRLDCTDHLGTESIDTVTCVESGSTGLTIASVAATTAALTIKGRSVAAGKAATALISGFISGTTHGLKWTVVTNGTLPRTFNRLSKIITK